MKTIEIFASKKNCQQKISMITCYDYTSATIVAQTSVDCVLVGDSASMVMLGHPNTTHATVDEIILFTQAVARGLKVHTLTESTLESKFIIADMPFMSYRRSLSSSIDVVTRLVQAGAQAVKLEGVDGNLELIQHLVQSGVPVMGHIGLTPQHIHSLGGFKVQGRKRSSHEAIIKQAMALEQAGCFSVILECMPYQLAKLITDKLTIPTIGIGAGIHTDGQVLVFQDLLGLQTQFRPKFVKQYLNGANLFKSSIERFVTEVAGSEFPQSSHHYDMVTS